MPYAEEILYNGRKALIPTIPTNSLVKLNIEEIKGGDILIWYSDKETKIGRTIKEATQGVYSHAGIYIGAGISIDAGLEDGINRTLITSLLTCFELGLVLRCPDENETPDAIVSACRMANEKFKYARIDAIFLPFRRLAYWHKSNDRKLSLLYITCLIIGYIALFIRRTIPPKKSAYCSQMVIDSYKENFSMGNMGTSGIYSPHDLATENSLKKVGYISNNSNPQFNLLDPNNPANTNHTKIFNPQEIDIINVIKKLIK